MIDLSMIFLLVYVKLYLCTQFLKFYSF